MNDVTCGACPNPCGGATPGTGGVFSGTLLAGIAAPSAPAASNVVSITSGRRAKTAAKPCWLMWVILVLVALTFAAIMAKKQ